MTSIKHFASALALVLIFLFFSTQAQTPSVSTVNVTPDESRVRVAAIGDVLDMRVAVNDEAGDVVFESGLVAGDKLDWAMKDAQGQRVPAGTYTMTVTYRTSNGKLRRRVEQVLVTEEVKGAEAQASSEPTPQAVGTITGQGTTGKIAKFTGANSIGNSVLTESSGRIGLGTTAPAQSLHVLGASSRLRLQSTGGASLTSTEYVTNNRVWQVGAGGSTALAGVASKFFVLDQTANQYRLVIDTSGNFGLGTTTPASRLTVSGNIQIVGAGNGIKFADGSIQTKAIAGTINGSGTANRLAKFTGPNSFGNSAITEVSGKVGIGTASPAARLHVAGAEEGVRIQGPAADSANVAYLSFVDSAGTTIGYVGDGSSGDKDVFLSSYSGNATLVTAAGRVLVATAGGNVGIGVTDPLYKLHVDGGNSSGVYGISTGGTGVYGTSSTDIGVYGNSTDGTGVYGTSSTDIGVLGSSSTYVGVYGSSVSGYAGAFQGNTKVTGTLEVDTYASATATHVCRNGSTLANCSSSLRYKSAVRPYDGGLAIIDRLRPISFDWKSSGAHDIGLGAEEVAAVEPLLTFKNEKGEVEGVKYDQLSAIFINAFKEQQNLIERQARQNEDQQRLIERQRRQLEQMQARLARVERTMRKKRIAKGR